MTKIITVTGTKGKTTIVRMLDFVLSKFGYETLRVDTDGHYVKGRQKSDYETSRKYWGMVPNNCPGRYLYELQKMSSKKSVAILEAAIGSSSLYGMGYARHDVGIFTNIYDDHITKARIKNRKDIYRAKRFIFRKISENGIFIFNSDDNFLNENLKKENIKQRKIAVGKDIKFFDKKRFLEEKNIFIRISSDSIDFVSRKNEKTLLNYKEIPITFLGEFEPNIYNLGFLIAALVSFFGESEFKKRLSLIKKYLIKYNPDKKGGRTVFLRGKKMDIGVVIDFAHEKESLKQIAKLAKLRSKNKVVGVVRIDPTRTDEDIMRTAASISKYYDFLYVYDKVDGVKSKESIWTTFGRKRGIGETAKLFSKGLKKANYKNYKIILQEESAFKEAYKNAKKGDIIVYIGGGHDHKKEYDFVKKVVK